MRKIVASLLAGLLLAGAAASPAWGAPGAPPTPDHSRPVCPAPRNGSYEAACTARQALDRAGLPITSASGPPSTALVPSQLKDAYGLDGTASGGRTVAIVDAYGYPNLERDLAVYRKQFGLPECSTANGCLTIRNQSGGTKLPRFDLGWAQEQALDVDAVSAACPDCRIAVFQASAQSLTALGTAVQTAAQMPGVVAVSNSYAFYDAPDSTYGKYYSHPGLAVTASAGDWGYNGAYYPASSSYVVGVGGTSLVQAANPRGWSETAWKGTGSGCSSLNAALPPASAVNTGCAGRAMNDVSAVSDPTNGGLAVYYPTSAAKSTWSQLGGTSEASPIIASVFALSGNTGSSSTPANWIPYSNTSSLFDVTTGSNGVCSPSQWCTAGTGWDGPTGLGTPHGVGGF
ncbi:S53 family peptidase [Sinomonas atrocyanea]